MPPANPEIVHSQMASQRRSACHNLAFPKIPDFHRACPHLRPRQICRSDARPVSVCRKCARLGCSDILLFRLRRSKKWLPNNCPTSNAPVQARDSSIVDNACHLGNASNLDFCNTCKAALRRLLPPADTAVESPVPLPVSNSLHLREAAPCRELQHFWYPHAKEDHWTKAAWPIHYQTKC